MENLDLDERKVRSYLWSVPNLCLKAIRLAAVAAVAGEAPLCAPFPPSDANLVRLLPKSPILNHLE
jgi:hypothetical protein